MIASLLGQSHHSVINNVTYCQDVQSMELLLQSLNIATHYKDHRMIVSAGDATKTESITDDTRLMRASVLLLGPLLTRHGHAKVPVPGGCDIGERPIDLHIKGLQALGAQVEVHQNYIEAWSNGPLKGQPIYLDLPSVGATENIMMAATLAKGTTTIINAACEPEIIDLAQFLKAMGSDIEGEGTSVITIQGVEELYAAYHHVISDRIEAGTYMIAAAVTRGRLWVQGANGNHLKPLIDCMVKMGVKIVVKKDGILVDAIGKRLSAVNIETGPYPGFPTDLQAQMMILLLTVNGPSEVKETLFENRFRHVHQLNKMGAEINIDKNTAYIEGTKILQGALVKSTDLRAGAALILAGMIAFGQTEITGLKSIDRGYHQIESKLNRVGGQMSRLEIHDKTKMERSLII